MSHFIKFGQQAALARKTGISEPQLSRCLSGTRSLSPAAAKRINRVVGFDPFIWLKGGSVEDRKAAVSAWVEKQAMPDSSAGGVQS